MQQVCVVLRLELFYSLSTFNFSLVIFFLSPLSLSFSSCPSSIHPPSWPWPFSVVSLGTSVVRTVRPTPCLPSKGLCLDEPFRGGESRRMGFDKKKKKKKKKQSKKKKKIMKKEPNLFRLGSSDHRMISHYYYESILRPCPCTCPRLWRVPRLCFNWGLTLLFYLPALSTPPQSLVVVFVTVGAKGTCSNKNWAFKAIRGIDKERQTKQHRPWPVTCCCREWVFFLCFS